MAGYLKNKSMSCNARDAINLYDELPLSQFNRDTIDAYIIKNKEYICDCGFSIEQIRKISIKKWKYVASDFVGRCSWHHMSKFYNPIDFYSLEEVLAYIVDNYDSIKILQLDKKNENAQNDIEYCYAIFTYFEKQKGWWKSYHYAVQGVIIDKWCYALDEKKLVDGKHFEIKVREKNWDSYRKAVKKIGGSPILKKEMNEILKKIKQKTKNKGK